MKKNGSERKYVTGSRNGRIDFDDLKESKLTQLYRLSKIKVTLKLLNTLIDFTWEYLSNRKKTNRNYKQTKMYNTLNKYKTTNSDITESDSFI